MTERAGQHQTPSGEGKSTTKKKRKKKRKKE